MTADMKKLFYEKNTGRYTDTLAAAKGYALQKRLSPKVYRIWMDGDRVIGPGSGCTETSYIQKTRPDAEY